MRAQTAVEYDTLRGCGRPQQVLLTRASPNRRLEAAVGDYVELGSAHRAEGLPAVDRLRRMVAASAAFGSDEALARQLRRQLRWR